MVEAGITLNEMYSLRPKVWWKYFKSESFAFKMISCYLFFEYVRPQSIFPLIDILPWAQVFVLAGLVGVFLDKDRKWVSSPLNKWMILYFLAVLWSTYNASYPESSYANLSFFYTWFIIYFLIVNVVTTPQRLLFFLAIICVASFKISLSLSITWAKRGFSFTDWGLKGPPGFFANSGELAIQMAVFWPIGLAVALALKPYLPSWKYRVLLLMPITACTVILGASSRGGQLAMFAQFVRRFYKQIFRLQTLCVVGLSVLLAWNFLPEEQKQRFNEAGEDKTSVQRLNYWEAGYEMLNDYPLTGVGYFNFPQYFDDYYPELLVVTFSELPHNIFIQVGADLGYPGLLIYIALIISALRIPIRAISQSDSVVFSHLFSALNISFLGFLVSGQFVSVVYYPFMWVHLAMCSVVFHISSSGYWGDGSRVNGEEYK